MRIWTTLAVLAALLGGIAVTASAGTNCTTQCYGYGNGRTCNTYCY
jgi:hypothetical protein